MFAAHHAGDGLTPLSFAITHVGAHRAWYRHLAESSASTSSPSAGRAAMTRLPFTFLASNTQRTPAIEGDVIAVLSTSALIGRRPIALSDAAAVHSGEGLVLHADAPCASANCGQRLLVVAGENSERDIAPGQDEALRRRDGSGVL